MTNIAVIDDDVRMLNNIRNILSEMLEDAGDVQIDYFQSGKEFLEMLDASRYQILVSDIDMPGMNGIEAGKKAREKYPMINIIFLTAYVEYAIESYRMDAHQYILKSEIQDRLPVVLNKLIESIRKSRKNYCYIGSDTQKKKVFYDDIIRISKVKSAKYVCYVTCEREYFERNSMDNVLKMLNSAEFILVDRSCAVNLRHIIKIRDTVIYLSNKDTIEASRARIGKVKECFNRYWREN
ncbi:MAG: LytTR family DNA-binding domain-containing protein [Eubacteriales bacterium]|nr:LytTR family DNA-binding domain-containing protein [Eubacteriales bacterium]